MACRDCFRGGIHTTGTPAGHMTTLHNTSVYISPAPNNTSPTPSKILYLSDGFGLALINNKLLADRYAAETGFDVIAPDVPPGGGLDISALELTDTIGDPVAWTNIPGQLSRIWAVGKLLVVAAPFIIKSRQRDAAKEDMIWLARALKADMATAGQGKLGVAGFCYGGWLATKLCNTSLEPEDTTDPISTKPAANLVDVAFTAHPSWLDTPGEIVSVVQRNIPFSLALSDKDMTLPLPRAEEIVSALAHLGSPEKRDYEVVIYRGNIPHGFAVRAREGVEVQIEAAEKAAVQAVAWFKRYLR